MIEGHSKSQAVKLFVGSVPAIASEKTIRDYFSTFGFVNRVVMFHDQSRNKRDLHLGYCHLVLPDEATAAKILDQPVHEFLGRYIKVRRHMKGGHLKMENEVNNFKRVILKKVPSQLNEGDIRDAFNQFGEVDIAYFFRPRLSKAQDQNRKTASVMFFSVEHAERALAASPIYIQGHLVKVEAYEHRPSTNKQTVMPANKFHKICPSRETDLKPQDFITTFTSLNNHCLAHPLTNNLSDSARFTLGQHSFAELEASDHIKPTKKAYCKETGIMRNHANLANMCFRLKVR